ncbi:hypothetical protein QBA35_31670 [Streptomyces bottropensis]|uniref:UspA domain-containing protein n=1 Tax=Streptomyces bottropensis TaxID=42235 RepID=A0ABU8AXA5_9ACTN
MQLLADALRPWRARHPEVRVLEDVVLFAPEHALILRSASAALVAAGQRVGSRVGSRAGSVTRALLRDSACPVAMVPG